MLPTDLKVADPNDVAVSVQTYNPTNGPCTADFSTTWNEVAIDPNQVDTTHDVVVSLSGDGSADMRLIAPALGGSDPPSASGTPAASFVRTCDTSVYGPLGAGWQSSSLRVGPVVFVGGGDPDAASIGWPVPGSGKGSPVKVITVVHGTRPTTISVGRGSDVGLLYDPATFGAKRMALSQRTVTFEPCGGGPQQTQFNGGFLVLHPLCARLRVEVEGQPVRTGELPLGAACP